MQLKTRQDRREKGETRIRSINPNSSPCSPIFRDGLDRAPLPLDVVHRPAALASPRSLLVAQILGLMLDLRTQNLHFHELPTCFGWTLRCREQGVRWSVSLVLRVWFLDQQCQHNLRTCQYVTSGPQPRPAEPDSLGVGPSLLQGALMHTRICELLVCIIQSSI